MQLIGQDEGKYNMLKDKKWDFEKKIQLPSESESIVCSHHGTLIK